MAIELGKTYTDPITKLTGVAVGRLTWLYACSRIGLQARAKEDGTVPDVVWFDEPQLESAPFPTEEKKKGGFAATPQRHKEGTMIISIEGTTLTILNGDTKLGSVTVNSPEHLTLF